MSKMSTALTRKRNRRKANCKERELHLKDCRQAIEDANCTDLVVLGIKGNLDKTIEPLNEIDDEIVSALDPDSVENDMEESMGVLRPTYEGLAGLTMKLETLALADSATSSPLIPPATSCANVSCKLPDLELPVFKGQAFKFCGFWDQFEVAIHRNGSLSPNLGFRVNPKPPRLHTPPPPHVPYYTTAVFGI